MNSAAPEIAPLTHVATEAAEPVVAIIGNPNSGKTTLFNVLTGSRAKVGNYHGITVEHREAQLDLGGVRVRLIDLPGAYSLVPRAEDEAVAVNGLLGRLPGTPKPSLVLAVVDATNLERNLYLVEQLLGLGLPVVVALSMMDTVEADGLRLDAPLLARRLNVPVIPVSATKRKGLDTLRDALTAAMKQHSPTPPAAPLISPREDVELLGQALSRNLGIDAPATTLGIWALSAHSGWAADHLGFDDETRRLVAAVPDAGTLVSKIVSERYARVDGWIEHVSQRPDRKKLTSSERATARIDAFALHKVAGPILLVLIFGGLFQALFSWSKPVMDGIQAAVQWGGGLIAAGLPENFPLLRSLIMDGLVAGVGNVVVFVPQIGVLFFCLGLLEDSGYLARAAFLLDRLLSRVGLHGRAFVPMLSGFACAVPAVLAARTIENKKDRLVTILVTPLISCSARLPVYGLMIATVFATQPLVFGVIHPGAIVMISMYALSIFAALGMAALFKRTILRAPPPPFVLELPPYRWPRLDQLARHVWSKVTSFLKSAGTVILAITIVLWALFTFPRSAYIEAEHTAAISVATTDDQREAVNADYGRKKLEHSVAGRVGHAVEPVIKYMGWDWKVGVGILASFAAREVLVSTLGLAYGMGEGAKEHAASLADAMRADRNPTTGLPVHTPLSGLSLMVFFVLAMQCMSTLAIVRRETGSWKWPAFQFAYMTVLALAASFAVYQGGRLLGFA